jgi:crossover junction endodeoxyribonuclease RusA
MITLKGNPISTSHIYKMRSFGKFVSMYVSKEGKDLKADYQKQAQAQWNEEVLAGELEINIKLYFSDKRKRDWDNYHKLSMDSLTGIVWEDDSQIQKATVEKYYCKENPRIEIIIDKCFNIC